MHEETDALRDISIHALREEGDLQSVIKTTIQCQFLSTPSARRATRATIKAFPDASTFLSTPSARRATTLAEHDFVAGFISIHALREEGDLMVASAVTNN